DWTHRSWRPIKARRTGFAGRPLRSGSSRGTRRPGRPCRSGWPGAARRALHVPRDHALIAATAARTRNEAGDTVTVAAVRSLTRIDDARRRAARERYAGPRDPCCSSDDAAADEKSAHDAG